MDNIFGFLLITFGFATPFIEVIRPLGAPIFFWLGFLFLLRPTKVIPILERWGRYGQLGLLTNVCVNDVFYLYFSIVSYFGDPVRYIGHLEYVAQRALGWLDHPASSLFKLVVPLPTFQMPDGSIVFEVSFIRVALTSFSDISLYVIAGMVIGEAMHAKRKQRV